MIEPARALEWIYDTLSDDSALAALVSTRIFDGVAPQGSAYPFVVFNHQGGSDTRGVGTFRAFNNSLYQVKAVGKGESYAETTAIADRIDAVLQGAAGNANGGLVLGCVRETVLMMPEVTAGISYRSVGLLMRLWAQAA